VASIKTGAVVVSWGAAIPGRERAMLEVLGRVLGYAESLRASGRIEELLLFVAKTGPNRDTLLLRGDLESLATLLADTQFEEHLQDGMLVVQDVVVSLWAGGSPDSVVQGVGLHADKLRSHGLI
jgi:hypothetical protein